MNSANLGPYGDAIVRELIPYIEKKYRGIGQGWARFLYGGSTGGWEALADANLLSRRVQRLLRGLPRPDRFPGLHGRQHLRPQERLLRGRGRGKRRRGPACGIISAKSRRRSSRPTTANSPSPRTAAQASNGTSGRPCSVPSATDGYPEADLGQDDAARSIPPCAQYWKEHYDLGYILQRDWKTLGPKLQGKIHIYVGDMDNYYLNNAVYLVESFLESTKDPYYAGEVKYGDRAEHCWNGDPTRPNTSPGSGITRCISRRPWNGC